MEPTPNQAPLPRKRILALCDFACATGFAQVAQNIIKALVETDLYQIDIMAINFMGLPNEWQQLYPIVRLFPAAFSSNGDVFGRQGFLNLLSSGQYDYAWTLQDTFQIEPIATRILELRQSLRQEGKKAFKWVFYFPVDAAVKENWITKAAALADVPVAYTEYGKGEYVRYSPETADKLKVIPHGIDTNIFKPLDPAFVKEFRHQYYMGHADDRFLVVNVNRNQPRKDIPRTLQIFKLFKQRYPNALLYLHMKNMDVGWHIDELARCYDLSPENDYLTPGNFSENEGLPVDVVNAIYNTADVVITTSLGEGWGLSMTEAMAAGKLVVAPDHSSLSEIVKDHGVLVPAGRTANDWTSTAMDNERLRPIVSVPHFVESLVQIAQHPQDFEGLRLAGYEYAKSLDWATVGRQWVDLFAQAQTAQAVKTPGRNDPCFCGALNDDGSSKKYKHCHGTKSG